MMRGDSVIVGDDYKNKNAPISSLSDNLNNQKTATP